MSYHSYDKNVFAYISKTRCRQKSNKRSVRDDCALVSARVFIINMSRVIRFTNLMCREVYNNENYDIV